ncbi:MAG: class III extradiol ring-cleavage dioxygenase [Alphaproteobacteria bacterium]
MNRFPSIFVSHGSPAFILEKGPGYDFLAGFGKTLGRPRAVICISAHWDTYRPAVSGAEHPATIYDFYGFPRALYEIRYEPPGAPELAIEIAGALAAAGMSCDVDPQRGLDHGAWTPLVLMYPEADIPCLQLSVSSPLGPDHHIALGRALARFRDDGILILGSGTATHNLREFGLYPPDSPPPDYVADFAAWLEDRVQAGDLEAVAHFRRHGPAADRNHPSDEHFLPLVVAMAAGASPKGRTLHNSFSWGMMNLASFAFD